MKWNVVFGMIVAAGSLTATAVKAQENNAGSGAPVTQQQAATRESATDAMDSAEPTTVGADGVPVAKPNPMSEYLEGNGQQLGGIRAEVPLVSDPRSDASATGGQTN